MKAAEQFRQQAAFLRESSGSTNIDKALHRALRVLKLFGIPHFVCGGYAVQEHGYPRFTADVDIIVPDVEFAREKLTINGFKANPGSSMTVTDRETKVEVDLLPAGGRVDPGPLSLPVPTEVSETPRILDLASLISSKLSTYLGCGIARAQDYADVVKLVLANQLPRDYPVATEVRELYESIWDDLHRRPHGR